MTPVQSVHIDLDGAWPEKIAGPASYVDARRWGPRLRYSAKASEIEEFHETIRANCAPFTLFGSGDFHHLSALWLRQIREPFTLVSFDNHPDWDVRPPHWCCGTWINRALELPNLQRVAIWGCGNFELNWPGYLFVSRKNLRAQRLAVFPWTERLAPSGRKRWGGIAGESWKDAFQTFARELAGQRVYVTVDLDCLNTDESVTNWEQGLFTAADIAWALTEIRSHASFAGGDVCGAASEPRYARRMQKFAADRDHPKLQPPSREEAIQRNERVLRIIWDALESRL